METRTLDTFRACLKKYYLLFIFSLHFFNGFTSPADWTILVYVQANNNLKNFAQHNFSDMTTIGSSKNLNILVQTYIPQVNGTSRYKIEKGKMVLDAHININSDGTKPGDLVDSMNWAIKKYPAKKYALILWNHGIGILDPIWENKSPFNCTKKFHIDSKILNASPRIQINGLTRSGNLSSPKRIEGCLLKGILFNEQTRNYMSNEGLANALNEIKTVLLKNAKLDILGMDACLMAMVEVGYQTRKFAHYLVASEEAELAHGWDYAALCEILSQNLSPAQVAQSIVLAYELCYKNKIQFYTQSAIDLTHMDDLKNSIDELAYNMLSCKNVDNHLTENLIKKARYTCLQFSASSYIDLHSFCSELLFHISAIKTNKQVSSKEFVSLKNSLHKINAEIEQAVIACTAGKQFAKVKGLSIYFPTRSLEQSYLQTEFGKNSAWTDMIISNIKNN
jgi:hypothetical protein